MWKRIRKRTLARFTALGGRAWTVGLVVLGLTPAAPAQNDSERPPLPERIERIRTALDEHGSELPGSVAAVMPVGEQEPEEEEEKEEEKEKKKKKKPSEWNDWDDWADF